jgi:transcription antitermination factor NusG
MDEQGLVRVGRRLKPKDRVRIKSGPFKDLLALFERELDDNGRVEILLQVLGFQARVQIHESLLEKIQG